MKTWLANALLPLVGIALIVGIWAYLSNSVATDLPSPVKTWQESKTVEKCIR